MSVLILLIVIICDQNSMILQKRRRGRYCPFFLDESYEIFQLHKNDKIKEEPEGSSFLFFDIKNSTIIICGDFLGSDFIGILYKLEGLP